MISIPTRAFVANRRLLYFPNGDYVHAQLATTYQAQERGLMFLESLGDNDGMLFEYKQPEALSFWMKNTLIPLSIAFIAYKGTRTGVIVDIQHMEPNSLEPHRTFDLVRASLEVNRGWFDQCSIKVGDQVIW